MAASSLCFDERTGGELLLRRGDGSNTGLPDPVTTGKLRAVPPCPSSSLLPLPLVKKPRTPPHTTRRVPSTSSSAHSPPAALQPFTAPSTLSHTPTT